MFHQRARYELTSELLTLIKNGNNQTSELMQFVHISRSMLYHTMNPLVTQGLITENTEFGEIYYKLTEKGELFQDYLSKTLSLLYIKNSSLD
jgi:predicted transcriptional regulator